MSNDARVSARQLWGQYNTHTGTAQSSRVWCTPLILPTGGIIVYHGSQTTTLDARATFKLPCDSDQSVLSPDTTGNSTIIGTEPFYASISPQIFALATATVISYILVILIFITPRTFYVGGPGGGSGFLSRSGLITSSYGSPSTVGVGRRPLLQKIAAVTVATSLTIATSDTFKVAKEQYRDGYANAGEMVDHVVNSLEIRIIRVVSDTFLWLAQVQTLIRLFPRHKEKVTIKWLGFAMVSFDTIFSILDSFVSQSTRTRPRSFQDAIPALNYLFELSISLIYASCVVYYSLSKRRFAFWHPKMRNVCLVALLSYISILIPVVFFVLDISLPKLSGWGEYIRWVGAAAASVVVWEWVERIESLERDERKDGILGREIFDGDEMLDVTPSGDADWRGRGGRERKAERDVEKAAAFALTTRLAAARAKMPLRRRRKRPAEADADQGGGAATATGSAVAKPGENMITVPPNVVTPPSRSDTTSAGSTVYAIRYHNLTSPSPAAQDGTENANPEAPPEVDVRKEASDSSTESAPSTAEKDAVMTGRPDDHPQSGPQHQAGSGTKPRQFWASMANPFKRRRAEPPAEVAGAQIASGMRRSPIDRAVNLKERFGAFASSQRERFGAGRSVSLQAEDLPVTVIPAPKANERTWSPDDVRDKSVEEQQGGGQEYPSARTEQREDEISEDDDDSTEEESEPDVVMIPVPTEGRTWSPPQRDAGAPRKNTSNSKSNSANSRRSMGNDGDTPQQQQRPAPPRTSTCPTSSSSRGNASTSRLTPPAQVHVTTGSGSTRSTFTRPVSISPISERLADAGAGVDGRVTPGSASASPTRRDHQDGPVASTRTSTSPNDASSSSSSPPVGDEMGASQPVQTGNVNESDGERNGDGRDSGGTGGGV